MNAFWQKVLLTAMAIGTVVVAQVVVKDPTAQQTRVGVAGTLIGWAHLPSPGAAKDVAQ